MEQQITNKYDFKNYLLEKLTDSKQDELIFWKKGIPLPIDLVYSVFEEKGVLIKKYLDQIASVILYSYALKCENSDWIEIISKLPSSEKKNNIEELNRIFNQYQINSKVDEILSKISDKLFVHNYNFSIMDFSNSICHEGRKYKRLYIPPEIKEIIKLYNIDILKVVGISNGDMFGNVVADEFGIYRSGFSDVFSAIFNKLLDFVLEKSLDHQIINYSIASNIRISQVQEPENTYYTVNYGRVTDGSLWEPKYVNANSVLVFNIKHPYFETIESKTGLDVLIDMCSNSALIENETIKDSQRKVLEINRQEISRLLRLKTENT